MKILSYFFCFLVKLIKLILALLFLSSSSVLDIFLLYSRCDLRIWIEIKIVRYSSFKKLFVLRYIIMFIFASEVSTAHFKKSSSFSFLTPNIELGTFFEDNYVSIYL